MIYIVILVVMIILASVTVLYATLCWQPDILTDTIEWTIGVTLPVAKWVAGLPLELMTALATVMCIVHTLVLTGLSLELTQMLRGESLIVNLFLKYATPSTRKRIDQLSLMLLERKWTRYLVYLVDGIAKLVLSGVIIVMRTILDPAVSRLMLTGVLLPILMAVTLWAIMPGVVMPVLKYFIPDGWMAKDGIGERSMQIVYVTIAMGVVICGGYIVLMHATPGMAAWLAGKAPPMNFLIGITCGLFAAMSFSAIYVDGNTQQRMVQAPPSPGGDLGPSAPDARPAHLAALTVSLFVAMAVHLILPILNRKQFARLWLLGLAPRATLSSAVSSVSLAIKSPVEATKGHNS